MLFVPRIKVVDVDIYASIVDSMKEVSENTISHANWADQYPSIPKVSFKIAHDGERIFLHYFVEEDEIMAKTSEDNGPVWTDSCVEFFISFDASPYYYNAEFSCIGKALLGYRQNKKDSERAGSIILDSIKRYPSLGTTPFAKRSGRVEWGMLLVIPLAAFWKSDLKSFSGTNARANFYKCGDDLTYPHYLSWNPIETENPNFHAPQFFAKLRFD